MIIIGLGHYSRTGKDTFANALVDILHEMNPKLQVGKRSFASKLKEITHELYSWAGLGNEDYYNDPAHEQEREVVLPAMGMTPVEVWVKFGTPAVREQVYAQTWVDYLLKSNHGLDVLIIPDVRFPNEVEAIHKEGGHLIKIIRDGYGPKMNIADLTLINYNGWNNIIGDRPPGCVDGMMNLRKWAARYAACIVQNNKLHSLLRPYTEIEKALAVQNLPTPYDIAQVYTEAGLEMPT